MTTRGKPQGIKPDSTNKPRFSLSFEENIANLEAAFTDCGDIVSKRFTAGKSNQVRAYIMYIDMMANSDLINNNVVFHLCRRLLDAPAALIQAKGDAFDPVGDGGVTALDYAESENLDEMTMAVLSGDTVLLLESFPKAVVIASKGFPTRGVQGAENEVVVQGPKDAFTESMRMNTMLVRRRIRDTKLKIKQLKVGQRSATDVALMYLDDVVRPEILKQVLSRIQNIDIDAILDAGCLQQFIEENWLSPFPQAQLTERPDKAASAVLEGRIAIIVDNSPFALLVPATMNIFFQSSEDYYDRWQIMSFVRIIRYFAGFLAVALPGLYLALATYHPSMIPMLLTFKMAASRLSVPFPAVIEIIIMELAFELLREAGIRLPGPIGGAIGIVGGLIVGQAAVEAGLVSPIVVIIVALTGICGFAIPNVSLVAGFRLMKYLVLALSAVLGLFGFWIALILILIHLVSLKSFGIPYLYPFAAGDITGYNDWKDSAVRFPLFTLWQRPFFASPRQRRRLNLNNTGNQRDKE